ncbi:bifunctional diaminohydroxyphosphoribosylaminopyrimidine deaminase/5-amino-6-(5-phosphoribosylamino)uracil reductase RibD [Nigerium sp.]|uniref:bifunctional diaminohydroxyphosphoribosylaminopyrimidine deaminase/5-amino-6-(5-phosphoribosylamino)uracil reductase RibD n=1 Tax=Nigerium sp. TaxID=2042655 RepID=UPI0032222369
MERSGEGYGPGDRVASASGSGAPGPRVAPEAHVTPDDVRHLRRALALAAEGPVADPNPLVGAVIVGRDGHLVGEGFHRGSGTPHAEAAALLAAGDAARGATTYVSLEPCNHTGRTPPCSAALLTAGVARVVYALPDPNPVAAGGAQHLRAAGVDVTGGVLAEEAAALNRTWLHRVRTGRPFVTWKFAGTLDGRAAAADGTSQWITGRAARADVHRLRARCGAIVTGTGTVLADDPHLTVRGDAAPSRQPLRVIVGERPVPAGARVLDDAAPTRVFATHDVAAVAAELGRDGVHHALLEGGPTLAAAFLRAGLVDEVVAYLAPTLLGAGASVVGPLGIGTIGAAFRLTTTDVTVLDDDVRVTATIHPTKE